MAPKFPGKEIIIDGEKFTVPALSLGQLRNGALALIQEHDKLLEEKKMFDSYVVRGKIVALALKRNYPDIEEEKLMESLDMGNINEIWLAVLGASGFNLGEVIAAAKGTDTTSGTSVPSTAA